MERLVERLARSFAQEKGLVEDDAEEHARVWVRNPHSRCGTLFCLHRHRARFGQTCEEVPPRPLSVVVALLWWLLWWLLVVALVVAVVV